MNDHECAKCRSIIAPGELYTRAYVRNDWYRDEMGLGEQYRSLHLQCPTPLIPPTIHRCRTDQWATCPGTITKCPSCDTEWVAVEHGPLDIAWEKYTRA